MTKSQDQVVRRVLAPCLALSLAVSSAKGDDGIVFPDDFDYSKGYLMCGASDGGGLGAAIGNTFFTKAVWKESADGPLVAAQAGKNYFQNGYTLNGPNVSDMTADAAARYLTFPGNKLVLGSGTRDSWDPYAFSLFNGSSASGETGLANASTKPYFFGGEGLVMAGNGRFALGRHGAVSGTLTVLADDHDTFRISQTNASNLVSDNIERWTRNQCAGIVANNHGNGWSMDVQANLVGGESAFLPFWRDGWTDNASGRKNICIISGADNSGYRGTLAVETNCVLRFKTSLVNGKVKVGYRGWGLPALTGTDGNRKYAWADFDPQATGMGYLEVPADTSVAIGGVENHNGTVSALAGATLTVGDLAYRGGLFEIAATASGCGKIVATESFTVQQRPIRVAVIGALASGSHDVLAFPSTSGLTLADFDVLGGVATLKETDGVMSLCVASALDEAVAVDGAILSGGLKLAISPTVGASASLTVTGSLSVPERPVRLGLVGSGNSMPQGELVKLISWRTSDNPALDVCDFDFTLLGNHDDFGPAGVGRGYPVLKTEEGMTTLFLDCTEVLKTAADTGFAADQTCFRNGDKWDDGQLPHLDANYFTNGKKSFAPMNLDALVFPDGVTVPGREFHGNRLRIGNSTQMQVEKTGSPVNFAQDGLVLQQGGRFLFCDPNIVISGKVHCASLHGPWTMTSAANRTGCENASSIGDTSTRFVADFTSDRRADFTVFASGWFAAGRLYACTFDGDMSGFLGTLVCENRCRIDLNRDVPNGTVKLGWTGLPSDSLGSLDDCANGWLSATCTGKTLSISNLVVNGAKVTVANGNTYALKALTLNGGLLDVSAFGSAVTQLAVDGPVAVTHATKVALAKRPTCRTPLKLISWPAAQSAPDTSLLALVKPDGSSWGEECFLATETVGEVTYLTARRPDTGIVVIVR